MKILTFFAVLFSSLMLLIVGGFLIAISFNFLKVADLTFFLKYLLETYNLRIALGICGILFVLISIAIVQNALGKIQREKTIAFDNPYGQVSVSLLAIEDYIRRLSPSIPEAKELKPRVIASKKGVEVSLKVSLWSDINIPEASEKIQTLIKSKVQELLGIDEQINVKLHVAKIVSKETKAQEPKKEEPFRIEYGKE